MKMPGGLFGVRQVATIAMALAVMLPLTGRAASCGLLPATYPVTAGASGVLNVGAGSQVNSTDITGSGNSIQMSAVRTNATPSFPALSPSTYPSFSSSTTTSASTVAAGTYSTVSVTGTTTFTGGTYYISSLTAGANTTLRFGAGTYYITTATLTGNTVSVTVSGVVNIYVGSNFNTGSGFSMNTAGTVSNLRIFLYPNANVSLAASAQISGMIYGPGGGNNVNLAKDVQMKGAIIVNSAIALAGSDGITLSKADQTAVAAISTCPSVPTPVSLWHLDESSWSGKSADVVDSGASGYNGTAISGASTASSLPPIAGNPGTCSYASLDGSSQYIQLPASMPHPGSTFTITAWIRPKSANLTGRIYWDDFNSDGFGLSYGDPGGSRVRFWSRNPSTTWAESTTDLKLDQWYFVAAVMDAVTSQAMTLLIYDSSGNLLESQSTSRTSFSAGTGKYAAIGSNANGSNEGSAYRFPGNIDEVTMYLSALSTDQVTSLALTTHPCVTAAPNHFAVSTPANALTCEPATVTITAHDSSHAAFSTTDTISISTSTGHGDWTLASGTGTFTAGSSNSGTASYAFKAGDLGAVQLLLRDTYAEALTVGVVDGAITTSSGSATSSELGTITFTSTGFRFTNGANVATPIGTQVAGVTSTQALALQAVRLDTNTGACTTAFASGTTVNVNLAYQCNNPATCVAGQTFSVTNNAVTTTIASNPATAITSYTSVPLKFSTANGEAPLQIKYSDVGQVTLAAQYNIPLGSGANSGNTMTGSGQFVVQPYTLTLSNVKRTSDNLANPAASTASGAVFIGAGQSFTATVTSSNAQGVATPNFGRETSPAVVTLSPALTLPASGQKPAVAGSFGSYTSGASTGAAFNWPEVGIIKITPTISNYLSSGAVTGTQSGNIGRFIPASFTVALNTPVLGTGCDAGAFTYVGQPMTYTVAPVITVTAKSASGTVTLNYTGSLFRLTNASLTARSYTATPSTPALDLSGLPASGADPAIADLGGGAGTLTFSAGTGLKFNRGGAIAPFSANIALSINVIDLDAVAAANPVSFGSGAGMAFSTSPVQRYGRLALRNAVGSELLDLPVSLTTQYYLSSTAGFITNTDDACTSAPAVSASGYQGNLSAGETCVRDTGYPGVSGGGCAAAAAVSSRYRSTALGGNFNLILAAPGTGNSGSLTGTATAPAWLQYLWNASSGVNSNPTDIVSFGLFPGPASRVYQREVY
jgi:MSHA biogenesis protein MshQ